MSGQTSTSPAQGARATELGSGAWLLGVWLAGAAAGALLAALDAVLAPVPPGSAGSSARLLGRVGVFLLTILVSGGWAGLAASVGLPFRRRVGLGRLIVASIWWLWAALFAADLAYRRTLGMRPTRSTLAPLAGHLWDYLRSVSWGFAIKTAVVLALLAVVAAGMARLSVVIAARIRKLSAVASFGLVTTLSIVAVVGVIPSSDGLLLWVQRGTPTVALLAGGNPTIDYQPDSMQAGEPIGAPDLPPRSSPTVRPNLLLVVLESVNPSEVGYGGAARPVTPNIDRLAVSSRRMRRAWSLAPFTSHALSGLLSSTLPRRKRGYDDFSEVDYPRESIFSVAQRSGMATASIAADDQGSFGLRGFLAPIRAELNVDAKDLPGEHFQIGADRSADERQMVTRALSWVNEQKEPWVLYVNFQRTHFPYRLPKDVPYPFPPSELSADFNSFTYSKEDAIAARNRYDGTLQFVDGEVGRLLAGIDAQSGRLDGTVTVLVADHGEGFGEHGIINHSKSVYESEARVPLLLRWPGHIEPVDDDTPVSLLDVAPTALGLLGLPRPQVMQGRDIFSGEGQNQPIFLEIDVFGSQDGVVCWPWKLIMDRASDENQLFDLSRDPDEEQNLAIVHPRVLVALRAMLEGMVRAQVEYHHTDERHLRYPPRLPACPSFSPGD